MKWQKSLWQLPSCQSGKPLTNIYQKFSFSLNNSSNNFATKLINKHSLEKVKESRKTEELNRRFLQAGSDETGGGDDSKALMERIMSSLRNADDSLKAISSSSSSSMKGKGSGTSSSTIDNNGEDDENKNDDGSSKSKTASQMNLTFQELIKSIQQEAAAKGNDNDDNHRDDYRGSRFAHATGTVDVLGCILFPYEFPFFRVLSSSFFFLVFPSYMVVFSQEADDGGINAAMKAMANSQSNNDKNSSSSSGGSNFNSSLAAASAAMNNPDQSKDNGATTSHGKSAASLMDRKAQFEQDEKQRQEEIKSIRNEIENLAVSCKFVCFIVSC
jgi:hypothetical protein